MIKKKFIPKARAFIFDMDGVIVDSMPYHFLAWYEALLPYGVRVSCFDVYKREGEIWDKTLKDFLKISGVKPTSKLSRKIYLERQRAFKKIFKRNIFSGAETLLLLLRGKGYLLGLVTGTPTNEIEKILPVRIKNLFDHIVAGNHVKNGKPHPEPYLKAAAALGVKPSECVVIENGPKGITSAKRAGMYCVAITTSFPKEYINNADLIIDRLDELKKLITGPEESEGYEN